MYLFEVVTFGEMNNQPLLVFAESYTMAVNIFVSWWISARGDDLPDLEVKRRNPAWRGPGAEQLLDALSLELSGIGHFDPNKGWTIVSPTYGEGDE